MSLLPSTYREVKIVRSKLTEVIKNRKQQDWKTACERLGLSVKHEYGHGSHCAVYRSDDCPPEKIDCLVLTIQKDLYPNLQKRLFKNLLFYGMCSGKYTEDDIWEALDVKI